MPRADAGGGAGRIAPVPNGRPVGPAGQGRAREPAKASLPELSVFRRRNIAALTRFC